VGARRGAARRRAGTSFLSSRPPRPCHGYPLCPCSQRSLHRLVHTRVFCPAEIVEPLGAFHRPPRSGWSMPNTATSCCPSSPATGWRWGEDCIWKLSPPTNVVPTLGYHLWAQPAAIWRRPLPGTREKEDHRTWREARGGHLRSGRRISGSPTALTPGRRFFDREPRIFSSKVAADGVHLPGRGAPRQRGAFQTPSPGRPIARYARTGSATRRSSCTTSRAASGWKKLARRGGPAPAGAGAADSYPGGGNGWMERTAKEDRGGIGTAAGRQGPGRKDSPVDREAGGGPGAPPGGPVRRPRAGRATRAPAGGPPSAGRPGAGPALPRAGFSPADSAAVPREDRRPGGPPRCSSQAVLRAPTALPSRRPQPRRCPAGAVPPRQGPREKNRAVRAKTVGALSNLPSGSSKETFPCRCRHPHRCHLHRRDPPIGRAAGGSRRGWCLRGGEAGGGAATAWAAWEGIPIFNSAFRSRRSAEVAHRGSGGRTTAGRREIEEILEPGSGAPARSRGRSSRAPSVLRPPSTWTTSPRCCSRPGACEGDPRAHRQGGDAVRSELITGGGPGTYRLRTQVHTAIDPATGAVLVGYHARGTNEVIPVHPLPLAGAGAGGGFSPSWPAHLTPAGHRTRRKRLDPWRREDGGAHHRFARYRGPTTRRGPPPRWGTSPTSTTRAAFFPGSSRSLAEAGGKRPVGPWEGETAVDPLLWSRPLYPPPVEPLPACDRRRRRPDRARALGG